MPGPAEVTDVCVFVYFTVSPRGARPHLSLACHGTPFSARISLIQRTSHFRQAEDRSVNWPKFFSRTINCFPGQLSSPFLSSLRRVVFV